MKINNQVAIVTWWTKWIWWAITKMLLDEWAKVVAIYSSDEKNAETFQNTLKNDLNNLICLKCDVAKYGDIEKAFSLANKEFWMVSILVSNVWILTIPNAPVTERFEKIFQINLFSQVYGTEIFSNQYKNTTQAWKIINISSILWVNPFSSIWWTRSPEYCTSKAASIMYTKIAACNLDWRILVNSISPWNTTTPPWENASPEFKKARADEALIWRFLETSEIAHTAKYILENDAINWEDIVVDWWSIIWGKKVS